MKNHGAAKHSRVEKGKRGKRIRTSSPPDWGRTPCTPTKSRISETGGKREGVGFETIHHGTSQYDIFRAQRRRTCKTKRGKE